MKQRTAFKNDRFP